MTIFWRSVLTDPGRGRSVHTASVATMCHLRGCPTAIFGGPPHVVAVAAAVCVYRSRGAIVSNSCYSPVRRVVMLSMIAAGSGIRRVICNRCTTAVG